ncbi:MAG: Spy/CpxP family protein refolding chaperone [Bacteroidota bacterium]
MDLLTKKKLLIGTIILLVVINISALSTIAYNRYQQTKGVELSDKSNNYQYNRRGGRQQEYNMRVKNFVKRELSLSDEQFEEFSTLKDIHIEESNFLMKEIGNRKKLVFKEFCKESQDMAVLEQLADEIGSLHVQIQKETFKHFSDIEEILTPEQLSKFKQMLCNMQNENMHGRYQKRNKMKRRPRFEERQ